MISINIYWLFLIIPVSIAVGISLTLYWIRNQIIKTTGVKSIKELREQLKKAQEIQKKMEEGDIASIFAEVKELPQLKTKRPKKAK